MPLINLIPIPTWRDIIDILFLTLVTYQLYIWFRETRALRVLIGLVVLGGIYSIAKFWGLFLTTWVFQVLWQVLLILLLILFQSEIRQVLEKVSPLRYLRSLRRSSEETLIPELVNILFEMAKVKTGVLIVIARNDNPSEFIHSGLPIMALPEPQLIKSIFNRHAPSHDGALVISQGRITQMGGILPLSDKKDIPAYFGTRHRAALGLTERTDAVCVVVSEERSEVATFVEGKIQIWKEHEPLNAALKEWINPGKKARRISMGLLKSAFSRNWKPKLGALALVTVAWLILASQQMTSTHINARVDHINTPPGMHLTEISAKSVKLTLSGNRNTISALKDQDVHIRVDLAQLSKGTHLIKLSGKNVDLPLGVSVAAVIPQQIKIILKENPVGLD